MTSGALEIIDTGDMPKKLKYLKKDKPLLCY